MMDSNEARRIMQHYSRKSTLLTAIVAKCVAGVALVVSFALAGFLGDPDGNVQVAATQAYFGHSTTGASE